MKRIIRRTVVAAAVAVVAGCSGAGAADNSLTDVRPDDIPPSSDLGTTQEVGSGPEDTLVETDIVSPVLEFQGGGRSADEIHNARTRAISSCMQQRGWTYEPVLQESSIPEPRTLGQLRVFRENHGYGLFTISESPEDGIASADSNNDYYFSLGSVEQQAYRQDLNGDIVEGEAPLEGSCEAVGNEATGTPLEDQAVMTELGRMYEAASQSIEYLSALDAWRACLSDKGYEVDHDGHPIDLIEEKASGGVQAQELADFEIAVAVVDFECSLTTTLPVLHRLETNIVLELVEKYPEWGS